MNSNQLRDFLHRSREWSRATRGVEMAKMAAKDLRELADVDSGFFVYQKRHPVRGHKPNKPDIYSPWGVFAGDEEGLRSRLQSVLQHLDILTPITERWMLAEDMPVELQREWASFGLLEIGIWPIVSREKMIGAVVVARTKPVFTRLTLEMATALIDVCAAQLSVALDLFLATRIAEEASQRDLLTGILNRRGLEARLGTLVEQTKRAGKQLVFGLVDLNDLKTINDTLGHPAGDHALQHVADTIHRNLGNDDVVARFGGDEFAVVVQVEESDAESAMNRIQLAVETQSQGFSVSVGGAVWGVDGDTLERCYQVADERLYECKRQTKVSG